MVRACGNNVRVLYGQKSVDGGLSEGQGTRETEVVLDGRCEGDLGQQRNDGGGCVSMLERSERLESPGA